MARKIPTTTGSNLAGAAQDDRGDASLLLPLLPAELASPKLVVCLTGATGYVAGHIAARLLAAGHTVHATCREAGKAEAGRHLLALPGAAERLRLFRADLLRPGSFDQAMAGCDAVVHTASPFIVDCPAAQAYERLIRPAVEGTENVLGSVERATSVRVVVMTASTACVFTSPWERGKGHVFTEADWNLTASDHAFPYHYSKLLAERCAYAAVERQGRWRLATILPPTVFGPPLSTRLDGESVSYMRQLLSGELWPAVPPLGMGFVDVRLVAAAHCLALVTPSASGRFLVSGAQVYPLLFAARVLRCHYPRRPVPFAVAPLHLTLLLGPASGLPRQVARALYGVKPAISTAKVARELGLHCDAIPAERTVLDMAAAMLQAGMVPAFQASPGLVAGLGVLLMLGLAALVAWLP